LGGLPTTPYSVQNQRMCSGSPLSVIRVFETASSAD
jgi:hypothetical protein